MLYSRISISLVEISELLLVFVAGFTASLIDGALGMGFGPTSSSILLGTGLSPAGVSTTVNLVKVATGVSAALAHWRFENIDRRLVKQLALPGATGALVGATVLASVDGDAIRPVLAGLLLLMGARILLRFSVPMGPVRTDGGPDFSGRGTAAVAAAGGITNGLVGAWGPVVTPFLLHRGLAPRFAIGSVNTAEVAVAVVASGSLLASVDGGVEVPVVLAMLAGGVVAAPLAASVIRFLPARCLGVAVGGLLLFLNVRQLASSAGMGSARWVGYGLVAAALAGASLRPRLAGLSAGNGG